MVKEKNKKEVTITHHSTVPLENTANKVDVGFDEESNIHITLKDYSSLRKTNMIPMKGSIDSMEDSRYQKLLFWYEKRPFTNELLWSIGINGLDENKYIKTKTMLFNRSKFLELTKIGTEYFFPDAPENITTMWITNILNMKNGYGLVKLLLKEETITVKEYQKKFHLTERLARVQLKEFAEFKLIKKYEQTAHGKVIYKLHLKKEDLEKVLYS